MTKAAVTCTVDDNPAVWPALPGTGGWMMQAPLAKIFFYNQLLPGMLKG